MRGSIVTPSSFTGPTQLTILAHLRYPACVQVDGELVLAYPCPADTTDLRYDRGVEYLGEALAARGFTVLIPELSPLYLNAFTETYDQTQGFLVE